MLTIRRNSLRAVEKGAEYFDEKGPGFGPEFLPLGKDVWSTEPAERIWFWRIDPFALETANWDYCPETLAEGKSRGDLTHGMSAQASEEHGFFIRGEMGRALDDAYVYLDGVWRHKVMERRGPPMGTLTLGFTEDELYAVRACLDEYIP